MSWVGAMTAGWLLRSALGGGLILLLAYLGGRLTRQPARQLRLAEWGMRAALVVAVLALLPGWVTIPLPVATPPQREEAKVTAADRRTETPPASPREAGPAAEETRDDVLLAWLLPGPDVAAGEPEPPAPAAAPAAPAAPAPAAATATRPWSLEEIVAAVIGWLAVAYAVVAAGLLARLLLGYLALAWLLRKARPAPGEVVRLFESLTPAGRRPRLLVSDRLRSPISCGLLRPTVVLPSGLCDRPEALRWAFAHELAHLRRRDLWTNWLFGVAQAVYFYLPWFWALKGRVRLCQEYLADAAVLDQEARPADYAQFLLSLNAAPLPAGATGVSGRPSELFRRVKMLLRPGHPLERRCPGPLSAAAAGVLVGLAVCVGGLRLTAQASPAAEPAPEPTTQPEPAPPSPKASPDPELIPQPQPETPPAEPAKPQGPPNLKDFEALLGRRADGRLGVRVERPEAALTDQLGLPPGTGLVIAEAPRPGSVAAAVGLRAHDVLLKVGGRDVPGEPRELSAFLAELPANAPLDVEVMRKSKRLTLNGLTLPEAPRPFRQPLFGRADVPALPFVGLSPGPGSLSMVVWTGPVFQGRHTEGALAVTVNGVLAEGQPRVKSVVIQDGPRVQAFADAGKVPESYRGRVQELLDMAAAGVVKSKDGR